MGKSIAAMLLLVSASFWRSSGSVLPPATTAQGSSQWFAVAPPALWGYRTEYNLTDVEMTSPGTGWAVGSSTVILRYNSGAWTVAEVSPASHRGVTLNSISMLSDSEGWAVGWKGLIRHLSGSSWITVTSPVTEVLRAVDMVSTTDGWAVGEYGTMIHYDGNAWTAYNSPTTSHLTAIDMVSASEGWAVGDTILHYSGGSWSEVAPPPSRLDALDMVSANEGWAAGDRLLMYYDGNSWTQVASPTSKGIYGLDMVSSTDGWAGGQHAERGVLLHYDGTSWTTVPLPASASPCDEPLPSAISMASATVGAAVGSCGTILRYDDAALLPQPLAKLYLPYVGSFLGGRP